MATLTPPDAYRRLLTASVPELDARLPRWTIEGPLPDELVGGTWWGNGPARPADDAAVVHPFDGHGLVRAVSLHRDGVVRLRTKFVATPTYLAEKGRPHVEVSGLATLSDTGWWARARDRRVRNVANTCVMPWGGDLLALWEGGAPFRLDPGTLDTLGPATFGGALAPGEAFLAHTRVDPERGWLLGLSPKVLGRKVEYTARAFDATGAEVWKRTETLDAFSVVHDFAVTPNWVLVLESSVDFDLLGIARAQAGMGTLLGAVRDSPRSARVLCIPRGEGPARVVDLGRPVVAVHHAAAWEEGAKVVLVTCAFERFTFGAEFGWRGRTTPPDPSESRTTGQRLTRFDLDPAAGTSTHREASPVSIDFPATRGDRGPGPTRHVWGTVTRHPGAELPLSGLAWIDLHNGDHAQWLAGRSRMVGEPLLVPRSDEEDDTWVVAPVYDPEDETTALAIFDGMGIDAGPVAQVRLPFLLPYGFHGWWQPG